MLRKSLMLLAVLGVVFSLSTSGYAGLIKGDISKGPIVSIDTVKNEITVADSRSGTNVTYKVSPDVVASFEKGQVVIVRSDSGSNVAKSVKLAQKKR